MTPIQPVILCGGAGTRLWPLSRAARPKPFIPLLEDGRSLFQETAERLSGGDFLPPLVIAGAAHAALVADQLAAIGVAPAAVIVEPVPRNTAAAAAVAAAWSERRGAALVLLAPADHRIADAAAFRAAVARGAPAAAKGAIVAFGVRPTAPHTGYGYIEAGAAIDDGVCEVAAFREKPDRQTAEHYLRTGRYSWNAGIFLFGPSMMTAELDRFAPAIARGAAAALAAAAADGTTLLLDPSRFAECPSDSIDYAVMEKTRRAAMVGPIDIGWSDIGSWAALPGAADARIVALDCAGASIRTDGPLVAAVGVEDLIIIAAADAVLVAPKSRAEDVKRIVEELKVRKRGDLL